MQWEYTSRRFERLSGIAASGIDDYRNPGNEELVRVWNEEWSELKKLGEEGWEMISVPGYSSGMAWFRRAVS
jgi:hypothetical protein